MKLQSNLSLMLFIIAFSILLFIIKDGNSQPKLERCYINTSSSQELKELLKYKDDRMPILSAHRGGPKQNFPENHTATFENTLKYSFALIEIDPRYTKDSIIIVHHDADLQRTTTGNGIVSEYSYKELKKLKLKDLSGKPTRYRIQTLKEMLHWARGKSVLVLDKKDVPIAERIRIVEECDAVSNAIIMAYTFDEAKLGYSINSNIIMQVFINSLDQVSEFDNTGVPWENIVVFVGHQAPKDTNLFEQIHQRNALCIQGTSRNLDIDLIRNEFSNIDEMINSYKVLLRNGVDILETDIPVELGKVLFDDVAIHPTKRKYFKKTNK